MAPVIGNRCAKASADPPLNGPTVTFAWVDEAQQGGDGDWLTRWPAPTPAEVMAAKLEWVTANPWRARQVELVLGEIRRKEQER